MRGLAASVPSPCWSLLVMMQRRNRLWQRHFSLFGEPLDTRCQCCRRASKDAVGATTEVRDDRPAQRLCLTATRPYLAILPDLRPSTRTAINP